MFNILRLTVKKTPFLTMSMELKDREYRVNRKSNWIKSRLVNSKTGIDKDYDFVLFVNGYGKDKPYFIAKYKGYEISKINYSVKYKNGFEVYVKIGTYRILFGPIIKRGNIYSKELFGI